jgi:hypothetical protein
MMKKMIILVFLGLITVYSCSKQYKYSASMSRVYGKWTAISKACVPGSVINLSKGTLTYVSDGYMEYFVVIDENDAYPEPFAGMPEDSVRYILRLLNPHYPSTDKNTYMALSTYVEREPYTSVESEKLAVMWKDFENDSRYFEARKANKDVFGWSACVYTK